MSLIEEAKELFGEMRDAKPEEQECIENYLKDISNPTGVNIFDLIKARDGRIDGKGIIVVDMVDKCEDCVFSNPDGDYCPFHGEVSYPEYRSSRPDDCPIKPIPGRGKKDGTGMSDDLISRKEAIDILENMIFEVEKDLSKSYLLQDARERIIGLNTAFDKEKVIDQLKELKMMYFLTIANTGEKKLDCAYKNVGDAFDTAIEIVKKGGIE